MQLQTALLDNNLSPTKIYGALRTLPYPVLLESAMKHNDIGKYSFLAADPFLVFEVKNGETCLDGSPVEGNPIEILRKLLNQYHLPLQPELPPFTGGVIGFFSYDLGWLFEDLPQMAEDDVHIPDCVLCFYDTIIAVDHEKNENMILSSGFPEEDMGERNQRSKERIAFFQDLCNQPLEVDNTFNVPGALKSHFNKESYCEAVQKVKDYIFAGDIFQANLTQRFSLPFSGSPLGLYQKLAQINPAPFASIFEWKDFAVVSASPERFLRVSGSELETRPIKGTRRRGKTEEEDIILRDELWNSSKDKAELTMIVDLQRNDLGRVCVPGTVRVPELYRLEQYATVWHLVSTVVGTLKPDLDICDLLEASFPGGSITGAPKIRAMEIIEELEPVKRSIYTGSIGYIGFNGESDLNIVIRTFIIKNGLAHIQVGGGIVADSEPDLEYEETLHKARALFDSLGLSGGNIEHENVD